jgi:hypothetical protein
MNVVAMGIQLLDNDCLVLERDIIIVALDHAWIMPVLVSSDTVHNIPVQSIRFDAITC